MSRSTNVRAGFRQLGFPSVPMQQQSVSSRTGCRTQGASVLPERLGRPTRAFPPGGAARIWLCDEAAGCGSGGEACQEPGGWRAQLSVCQPSRVCGTEQLWYEETGLELTTRARARAY